jgi:hypothetical protein
MRRLAFVTCGLIILGSVVSLAFDLKAGARWGISHATFVVLALTLVALILYTLTNHQIASVTSARWKRESVLSTNLLHADG